MGRVFVTGDCHGSYDKFNINNFPIQVELTKDDYMIICGDFGIWDNSGIEKLNLHWLSERNFTILFVDGNHENFDRLYSKEFPIVDFHGGKAHKIRDNIYHLMRGYVFDICGKTFFAFGGAQSHDIQDGVYEKDDLILEELSTNPYAMYRINHLSWWKEELPSPQEIERGWKNLKKVNYKVDYIITHCGPSFILPWITEDINLDIIKFFDEIKKKVDFKVWYLGHYHTDSSIYFSESDKKINVLYDSIEMIDIEDRKELFEDDRKNR